MKRPAFIILILLLNTCTLFAQPAIEWQKSLGGSNHDNASYIQQTIDGGYIVGGSSSSNDFDVSGHHNGLNFENDYWIVKIDRFGSIEWQNSLGGFDYDNLYCAIQTLDSGYILAGSTISTNGDVTGNHGMLDCWIVKLDNNGALLWQKSLGGSDDDEAKSIQQTNDGGYIICGMTASSDGDLTGTRTSVDY
jgi:hypothetical protein